MAPGGGGLVTVIDGDLSRVVSHALRHEPWPYELELDEAGWVSMQSLVEALRLEGGWSSSTVADVAAMVADGGSRGHLYHRQRTVRGRHRHLRDRDDRRQVRRRPTPRRRRRRDYAVPGDAGRC